jgi:hypothetical protein
VDQYIRRFIGPRRERIAQPLHQRVRGPRLCTHPAE